MLHEIRVELDRIEAQEVRVRNDDDFEPAAGTLVCVEDGDAYWHLLPQQFLELLRELPEGVGAAGMRQAIERLSPHVWHGPAPRDARDTLL